jgi:hypothetical protein
MTSVYDLDPTPGARSWRVRVRARVHALAALLRGTHHARIPF